LRVTGTSRPARLARRLARSSTRSPRRSAGGVDGARRLSAAAQRRRRRRRAPAQRDDPGDKLREVERLGQVVVGTQVEPVDPLLGRAGGRQHQNPGPSPAAGQPGADLVPVHRRQVPVEHDHVVGGELGLLQPDRAIVRDVHGHSQVAQALGDRPGHHLVILDNQHPHPFMVPPQP